MVELLLVTALLARGGQLEAATEISGVHQPGPVVIEKIIFSVRQDKERIILQTNRAPLSYDVLTAANDRDILIILSHAETGSLPRRYQPGFTSIVQAELIKHPAPGNAPPNATLRLTLREGATFQIRRGMNRQGLEVIFPLVDRSVNRAGVERGWQAHVRSRSISTVNRGALSNDRTVAPVTLTNVTKPLPASSYRVSPPRPNASDKLRPTKPTVVISQAKPAEASSRTKARTPEKPISLDQLLELALKNNPGLAAARRGILVAEQGVVSVERQRFPRVDIGGSVLSNLDLNQRRIFGRTLIRGTAPLDNFTKNIFHLGTMFSVPIYTGGRIPAQIEIGKLSAAIAKHRFTQTQADLIFNVSSTYFSILKLKRLEQAVGKSQDALTESQRVAQRQLEVGKLAEVDLLKVRTRLAEVEQALIKSRTAEARARAALSAFLGSEDRDAPFDLLDRLVYERQPLDLQASLEQALRRRPKYLAKQKELERQVQQARLTSAGRLPQVKLTGSYLLGSGDNFTPPAQDATAQLRVTFPIFDGGVIRSKVARERLKAQQLKEQLRNLKLGIMLEVETALLNAREAESRIKTAQAALQQANEALRVERLRLAVGKSTIEFLLDAQAAQLRSQVNHIEALADYQIALAGLRRAVGAVQP